MSQESGIASELERLRLLVGTGRSRIGRIDRWISPPSDISPAPFMLAQRVVQVTSRTAPRLSELKFRTSRCDPGVLYASSPLAVSGLARSTQASRSEVPGVKREPMPLSRRGENALPNTRPYSAPAPRPRMPQAIAYNTPSSMKPRTPPPPTAPPSAPKTRPNPPHQSKSDLARALTPK